jgi:PKD repeat protein
MMTHFFGIYVYVSQPPPQKSYTFFIGSARHVGGIDFTYSSSFAWIFPLLLAGSSLPLVAGISLASIISPPSSNNPIRPTADFSFYPIELTTDNIIHFSDKSTDEDGIIEFWSWDFGDEHNSVKQNPQHQYITSGTYTVSLEITDSDGNTNSISKAIIIRDPPTVEEDSRDDNTHGDKDVGGTLNFGILIALISIIAVAAYMWKRK